MQIKSKMVKILFPLRKFVKRNNKQKLNTDIHMKL